MSDIEDLEFDDYYHLAKTKDEKEYEKQFPYIKDIFINITTINRSDLTENTNSENSIELENINDEEENYIGTEQEEEEQLEEDGPYFDLYDTLQREPTIKLSD